MLDEMFKGTNSQDRYRGGVSLIKQLSELNAFGIISTHDLELAELAGKRMIVANHSFNSKIHSGQMIFNYKQYCPKRFGLAKNSISDYILAVF